MIDGLYVVHRGPPTVARAMPRIDVGQAVDGSVVTPEDSVPLCRACIASQYPPSTPRAYGRLPGICLCQNSLLCYDTPCACSQRNNEVARAFV